MSQCKTKAELHREYARVIDMCNENGSALKSWSCVKYFDVQFEREPEFIKAPSDYQFALAIVEGKPVFPGDTVYNKITGEKCIVGSLWKIFDNVSFNPPKPKKLVLNGVELPMPCDDSTVHVTIPFDNIDLANQFRKQFFDLVAAQKD